LAFIIRIQIQDIQWFDLPTKKALYRQQELKGAAFIIT